METITQFIVRAADLAEAEGRLLRAMTVRLALGIAVIIVSAGALTAGVAFLLAAVYIAAANQAGAAIGALVAGFLALAMGGLLAWLGSRIGG